MAFNQQGPKKLKRNHPKFHKEPKTNKKGTVTTKLEEETVLSVHALQHTQLSSLQIQTKNLQRSILASKQNS